MTCNIYEQNVNKIYLLRVGTLIIVLNCDYFEENMFFVKKNSSFNLNVALFVEKRQNKFAHELKKNKFVFNY